MLSAEQTEMLTKVGPGTPMGELLRRYWTLRQAHASSHAKPALGALSRRMTQDPNPE